MEDRKPGEERKDADDLPEATNIESITHDYEQVITAIVGIDNLKRFKEEFEKLHQALRSSHENESRYITRCKELKKDILAYAQKVQTAIRIAEEDGQNIETHKKQLEEGWQSLDQAKKVYTEKSENLDQLKSEIEKLREIAENQVGIQVGQTSLPILKEKTELKGELMRERDLKNKTLENNRKKKIELMEKKLKLEETRISNEAKDRELKDKIAQNRSDAEREEQRKKNLEGQMETNKKALEEARDIVKNKDQDVQRSRNENSELKERLRMHMEKRDRLKKELRILEEDRERTEREFEEQRKLYNLKLREEERENETLKERKNHHDDLAKTTKKLNKDFNILLKHKRKLLDDRDLYEKKRDDLRKHVQTASLDVEQQRKIVERDKKSIEEFVRNRDLLNKDVVKADERIKNLEEVQQSFENELTKLENEVQGYKSESAKLKKLIYQLEKDKQKYSIEASQANAKYFQCLEEMKAKRNLIEELQKRNVEKAERLKQQQNLYEAVRSDRNLYSKNLIDSQEEIAELKRKFKIMSHTIDNLKEEINVKDSLLTKEHFNYANIRNEVGQYKKRRENAQKKLDKHETVIKTKEHEISRLKYIITEAEQERQKQKKDYEMVINERDILGTQLIRRNEELALLYEKIKIQQSTLAKGEIQYQERLQDIELLKNKISELKREHLISKNQVSCTPDLKREVYNLEKELLEERTKSKALSEDLEKPMNIHRWRKLEGTDPETYELITKIQTLQRRLIAKTEEVAEKDALIQEKEKLYVELKNILARQPGADVAEQLSIYQKNLKEKTRQMKEMVKELKDYEAQVNQNKFEIQRLDDEIKGVKGEYFSARRQQQYQAEGKQLGDGLNPIDEAQNENYELANQRLAEAGHGLQGAMVGGDASVFAGSAVVGSQAG